LRSGSATLRLSSHLTDHTQLIWLVAIGGDEPFIQRRKIMTTTTSPANFDGQKPVIDPNDAVMLLIDHQSGLFQTVGDIPVSELRARAAALAKMAALSSLPVITTASVSFFA
jgi:hypothetical protein